MFTINNLTCRRNTFKIFFNKLLEKVELKVQEWVTVGDHKYHVSSPTAGTGHCSGLREHWCKRKKENRIILCNRRNTDLHGIFLIVVVLSIECVRSPTFPCRHFVDNIKYYISFRFHKKILFLAFSLKRILSQ